MKKLFTLFQIVIFTISCSEDMGEIDPIQPVVEKTPIGEKGFKLGESYLFPKVHVTSSNQYIATGTLKLSKWINGNNYGEYILTVNDKLSQIQATIPPELTINGDILGGINFSSIVENDNLLIYGVLNYSKCYLAKYTSNGQLIWFKEHTGEYSNLLIRKVLRIENYYYYLATRYTGRGHKADFIIEVGKMDLNGNILFNKVLNEFSAGYEIEYFDANSFLISGLKYYEDGVLYQGNEAFYDKVQPFVLKIDLNGNILWESMVDELTTDLFQPALHYMKKGLNGIYSVYQRRSSGYQIWLTKTDFEGNYQWTKELKGIKSFKRYEKFSRIIDICLDNEDNIYAIGYATMDAQWGPYIFGVAKFDMNGNYLNSYTNTKAVNSYTDPEPEIQLFGESIAVDKKGNIITLSKNVYNDQLTFIKFNKDLEVQ